MANLQHSDIDFICNNVILDGMINQPCVVFRFMILLSYLLITFGIGLHLAVHYPVKLTLGHELDGDQYFSSCLYFTHLEYMMMKYEQIILLMESDTNMYDFVNHHF